MADIYATIAVPVADVETARSIGSDQWMFTRACTTDANGAPPATHYATSGQADADLLALILLSVPSTLVNYTDSGIDALTSFGLRFVVDDEI
jgi:hypothetical protein